MALLLLILLSGGWFALRYRHQKATAPPKIEETSIPTPAPADTVATEQAEREAAQKQKKEEEKVRKQQAKAEQQARENARLALDHYMTGCTEQLFAFDFSACASLADTASADPVLKPLHLEAEAFFDEISTLCALPEVLCRKFETKLNKGVKLSLKSGKKVLIIRKVQGTSITADRVLFVDGKATGTTPENFTFDDLSPKEIARLVGKKNTPDLLVLKGLLLYSMNKPEKALTYFNKVDSPVALLLQEHTQEILSERQQNRQELQFTPVFEPDENNQLIIL